MSKIRLWFRRLITRLYIKYGCYVEPSPIKWAEKKITLEVKRMIEVFDKDASQIYKKNVYRDMCFEIAEQMYDYAQFKIYDHSPEGFILFKASIQVVDGKETNDRNY